MDLSSEVVWLINWATDYLSHLIEKETATLRNETMSPEVTKRVCGGAGLNPKPMFS